MSRICPRSHTHYCNNIGPSDYDPQYCYPCWCWFYRADIRQLWGGSTEPPPLPEGPEPRQKSLPPITSIPPAQKPGRTWCKNIGRRLTYEAGCASGWKCKWECGIYDKDEGVRIHLGQVNEAVPGSEDDCQSCPSWLTGEKPA